MPTTPLHPPVVDQPGVDPTCHHAATTPTIPTTPPQVVDPAHTPTTTTTPTTPPQVVDPTYQQLLLQLPPEASQVNTVFVHDYFHSFTEHFFFGNEVRPGPHALASCCPKSTPSPSPSNSTPQLECEGRLLSLARGRTFCCRRSNGATCPC